MATKCNKYFILPEKIICFEANNKIFSSAVVKYHKNILNKSAFDKHLTKFENPFFHFMKNLHFDRQKLFSYNKVIQIIRSDRK